MKCILVTTDLAARSDRALERALLLARETGAGRVLEVGCGTGYWLAQVAEAGAGAYGLDLSAGMLSQAQERGAPLYLVRGRAGSLPFVDGAFEMVYCVNALHHFAEQEAFVREAWRLLAPGGRLAILGSSPHDPREQWYIHDYFEGTRETDLARFPSWGNVVDWMVASGFDGIGWRTVQMIDNVCVGRAVFDAPFLKKHAVSQLAMLSDAAYAAGLARMEEAIAAAEREGRKLNFCSRIRLAMMTSTKPGTMAQQQTYR